MSLSARHRGFVTSHSHMDCCDCISCRKTAILGEFYDSLDEHFDKIESMVENLPDKHFERFKKSKSHSRVVLNLVFY